MFAPPPMMKAPPPKKVKVYSPKKSVRVMHDEDVYDEVMADPRKPKVIGKGVYAPKKPYKRKCYFDFTCTMP